MKRKIATIQKAISLVEKGMESYTAILIDLYRATVSFRRAMRKGKMDEMQSRWSKGKWIATDIILNFYMIHLNT